MQSKIASLASDTVVYGVSTVAGRFLTFLLTPLYTNYLTASEIGDVTAIYAMIAFVNILYSLGMEPAFMRFWDQTRAEENRRVFTVSFLSVGIVGVLVTLTTVALAGTISSSPLLNLDGEGAKMVAIAAIIPLIDALILIPFARLRMQRRAKKFALLRLLSVVVTVALNMLFVVSMGWRIEGVLWAGILGSTATLLFMLPALRDVVVVLKGARSGLTKLLKEMVRFGLPTVPASFSSIMVQVADRPIMLLLTSSAMLGMYQTNFRLAIPMMMFVTVFEYAWKPFYLNHRTDPDAKQMFARVLTYFTVVCGVVFLLTALLMPYVVQLPFIGGRFVNPAYWSGLTIVPVVLLAYYINGVFINMAAGFHIEKRTGYFPLATGVAAAVSVGATFLFVPEWGLMGAAWAKVAAYASSVIILGVIARRIYPVAYDWVRITVAIALAAGIYAGIILLGESGNIDLVIRLLAAPLYVLLLVVFGVVRVGSFLKLLRLAKP